MNITNGAGIEVSCGCYSGTPESFDALRIMLSMAAGYGVKDMRHVGGPVIPDLDWYTFSTDDLEGEWPNGAPDDPLVILLAHHEHTGRIKKEHASYLADRLEELSAVLLGYPDMRWALMTQQFVRGLRFAVLNRMDIVFS
jgi:hypothetical protein